MDYKLEALHKVYKWWKAVVISAYVFLILIGIASFVLAMSFESITLIVIFTSLFAIMFVVVAVLSMSCEFDDIIPSAVLSAEQEYQLTLEKEKRDADDLVRKSFEKHKQREEKLDYLISQKDFIARLVENVGVLEWVARNYEGIQVVPVPKMSTLDKKLEPKKPYKIYFDDFIQSDKPMAIHVNNEEEAIKVVAYKNKARNHHVSNTQYDVYEKETCYSNNGNYCSRKWYIDNGYAIYDFSEVCFEPKKKGGK